MKAFREIAWHLGKMFLAGLVVVVGLGIGVVTAPVWVPVAIIMMLGAGLLDELGWDE